MESTFNFNFRYLVVLFAAAKYYDGNYWCFLGSQLAQGQKVFYLIGIRAYKEYKFFSRSPA
jgi:hypothetical protein